MLYWLAVGPVENWKISLERGVWGLSVTYLHSWERVQAGDIILFYATLPARGVIGYGVVTSIKRQREPIWPEEVEIDYALWPLRLYFQSKVCLPLEQWQVKSIRLPSQIPLRRAFQQLRDESARKLLLALDQLAQSYP